MRKWKHIIPLVVFAASMMICAGVNRNRATEVARIIDKAGREGKPIIAGVAYFGNQPFLASIDGDYVNLPVYDLGYGSYAYFTPSGILNLAHAPGISPASRSHYLRFPNIYIESAPDPYVPPNFHRFSSLRNSPGSTKIMVTPNPEVITKDTGYFIWDMVEGTLTPHSFAPPPPIGATDFPDQVATYVMSPDAKVIIRRIALTKNNDQFWRYDVVEGKWSKIVETSYYAEDVRIGPEARILGLSADQNGVKVINFIDGFTGQPIVSYQDLDRCIIGERWIVCRLRGNPWGFKVFDITNNWSETLVPCPRNYSLAYAVYYPPPGGVDEMLRMRKQGIP